MNHKGKIIYKDGQLALIAYRACGFSHQFPLPDKKKLEIYYKNNYFQTNQKNYYLKKSNQEDYLLFCIKEVGKKITQYLPSNLPLKLLDIGCGNGHFLKFFQEKG